MQAVTDMLMEVAGSIGTRSFYSDVMHGMLETMASDHSQVIHYPAGGRPECVVDEHTSERLRRLYRRFCPYDPFYRDWLMTHRAGLRQLHDVQPPDYDEGGYYTNFYSVTGYADEVGLLFPALKGSAIGVFVQRGDVYRRAEVEFLSRLFPALRRFHVAHRRQLFYALAMDHTGFDSSAVAIVEPSGRIAYATDSLREVPRHEDATIEAVRCHAASDIGIVSTRIGPATVTKLDCFPLAPSAWIVVFGADSHQTDGLDSALANFGEGLLSRREHQICCLAFSGLGNVHIADVLGISEGTVKNLRKRLYFKMDVTCERELFALFLAHLRTSHKTQTWPAALS